MFWMAINWVSQNSAVHRRSGIPALLKLTALLARWLAAANCIFLCFAKISQRFEFFEAQDSNFHDFFQISKISTGGNYKNE
jgi:hypothetical protein